MAKVATNEPMHSTLSESTYPQKHSSVTAATTTTTTPPPPFLPPSSPPFHLCLENASTMSNHLPDPSKPPTPPTPNQPSTPNSPYDSPLQNGNDHRTESTHSSPPHPPPPPPTIQNANPITPSNSHPLLNQFADMSLTPHIHYPPPMHMIPIHHLPIPPQHPPHMPHHRNHHILQQHQPNTFYLWVPQDRVGAVIGGHGAVIKSLQERSGATIQVHNDTVQGDLKLFTIFGTVSQYETARQLVNDIVERPRPSRPSSHAGSVSSDRAPFSHDHVARSTELCKTVYIPTSCVGLVIGRGGETIRNLQNKSGAEIKVTPDEEAAPGSDSRPISISGSEEAIATAHQLVSEIVVEARARRPPNQQLHASSINGQPQVMEYLAVPNEKVGLIIGKRGAAIRELQIKSGAKIQVTKDDTSVQSDGTRPVTITGIRPNVDQAKKLIAAKINMPLPTTLVSTPYASAPSSNVQSPSVPTHGLPYVVPSLYDAPYQNGHPQPFQQVYDSNDPNAQGRAMAYVPYFGYNSNYAVLAQQQQRHFQQAQQQVPVQYATPVGQPATSAAQPDHQSPPPQEQQEPNLPSQYQTSPNMQQPPVDNLPPGTMMPRDANGNILMYPQQQHFQQMPHHLTQQQMYSSAQNAHVFSQRDHAQAIHAHAQVHMYVHAQAQAQAVAQAQAEAQARQSNYVPTDDPRTEDSEQQKG